MTDVVSSGQLLLAIPLALLAGLVSFASPCVLPLVPGYLAYVGGFTDGRSTAARGDRRGRTRVTLGAALFVLGFALVFVAFGVVFGAAGFWLVRWADVVTRVSGVVVVVLGLVFIGRVSFLQRAIKPAWRPATGLIGAPILGVVFGLGWTPCIGPALGAILTLGLTSASVGRGALLALVYAIGLGIPFVLVAFGIGWATRSMAFLKRHVRAINILGGVLLIVIGLLMVTGLWNGWIENLQVVMPFVPSV